MPRDGSNIYHTPAGTAGIPNTTIASSPYNGYLADIEQDLNLPRPIVAGGTAATTAVQAIINLNGETSHQLVTNYDSNIFLPGSFYSAAGATSAPTGNAFRGIAIIGGPTGGSDLYNTTLEARDSTTGLKYVRVKSGGVWGAWSLDGSNSFVAKAGDTMTGDLTLSSTGPDFIMNKASGTAGTQTNIWGMVNNVPRWLIQTGNEANESGSNNGSNFTVQRYSDAGAFLGNALSIARSSGIATFTNNLVCSGAVTASGGLWAADSSTTGSVYFGIPGAKSLQYDGTTFNFNGGPVNVGAGNLTVNGSIACNGYLNKAGTSGATTPHFFNIYWTGSAAQLWNDTGLLGSITVTSDYRTKKDVRPLPGMWDTVKKLRPIKYTQTEFQMFKADNIERWGFIAHELQETLVPSASSGVKDAPNEIQSPNPLTVIAALTKALQEAMSRIEALEAKHPT